LLGAFLLRQLNKPSKQHGSLPGQSFYQNI
jgi:hypothetical protein